MLYTIKSATATATISSLGAELQSLSHGGSQSRLLSESSSGSHSGSKSASIDDSNQAGIKHGSGEALWQGTPEIWSGRAPLLFPIVGALKDNQYTHKGRRYELPRHGFARKNEFSLIEQGTDSVTLLLQADSSSLEVYPWQFELTIRFSIHQSKLLVSYSVVNKDTTPMWFTIGSHPAFALQDSPAEYTIHFSKSETLKHYPLTADGLLLPAVDYLQNSQKLPLSETIFDDDALIFKNIQSDAVSLYHRDKPVITVDNGGAPHLGIWAKPAAPFVCIEPWFGFSDDADGGGDLANKPSMKSLPAGDFFNYEWSILLHQY